MEASRLVRLIPERAVQVEALAGDVLLCSWAKHLTHSASLQLDVQMGICKLNVGGDPAMD